MIERYAVMTADLKGMSLWDNRLETCKKYCQPGSVVVERKPVVIGFSVLIVFTPWPHIFARKEYGAKIMRIVWPKEVAGPSAVEPKGQQI